MIATGVYQNEEIQRAVDASRVNSSLRQNKTFSSYVEESNVDLNINLDLSEQAKILNSIPNDTNPTGKKIPLAKCVAIVLLLTLISRVTK